ncbi:MAG: dTMP kinase [Gemmatimonadaceae bacterium]|nr:dTMP kinase [Gemmatimonadaceae bacterium]
MARGKLIVFEGAEGAGKTTQLRLLAERLASRGVDCVTVREPGGTPVGDLMRTLLLDPEASICPPAEALLFMASRAELVARELRPKLSAGKVIIVDRFFLSTYAYQVVGRGLPEEDVRAANRLATGGLVPDLTILLEVPVALGMERADSRGARDRMERSGDDFHARVSQAFALFTSSDWQSAHPECGPIVRVDSTGPEETVFGGVAGALIDRLPETFSVLKEFQNR